MRFRELGTVVKSLVLMRDFGLKSWKFAVWKKFAIELNIY